MRLTSRLPGFTLIEIIVSVTLLLVLSGLLIVNYNGFSDAQTVKQAASTMRSNLQAARTRAASGAKPEGCDELVGYQVDFPTATTYRISPFCVVAGTQQEVGVGTVHTLPRGVTFTPIPQSTIWYALGRGASVAQTIQMTGVNNKTATVSIAKSGTIN